MLRAIGERRARRFDPVHTEVARPPGRFVTGEESALAAWLDGRRAAPVVRTDKSIPLRVNKSPVLVHNAETLAHVSLISRYGARWFRELGTPAAPGTTLVTVSGAVEHPGVFEVAMGTPLSRIIDDSGPAGATPAVIVGGYGGSFVASGSLQIGFSPEELATVGATTGAGVIAVLAPYSCGVAETARVARYMALQSAGQCGPCVFGLPAIASSLEQVWRGDVAPGAAPLLARRIDQVSGRGACRHPDGVARLVSSALRVFADDFAAHAAGRPCPGADRPSVLTFGPPSSDGVTPVRSPVRVSRPPALKLRPALKLVVDPIACEAYGYCAELLGEIVSLDEWGYPIVDGSPVPTDLVAMARKAARDCPRRALSLSEGAAGRG